MSIYIFHIFPDGTKIVLFFMNLFSMLTSDNLISLLGVVPKEYCFQEKFNVTCPANHVIIMRYALYGRMQFGRCMQEDHGHTGCFADVLATMDEKCSGLRQCQVEVPLTGVTVPQCPKELMKYLEADYRCQKGGSK